MKKTRQQKLEEIYRLIKEECSDGKYIAESTKNHMERIFVDIVKVIEDEKNNGV